MKQFNIFFLSTFLLLLIGGVQTTIAQSDSNWKDYARNPESIIEEGVYVYLYNVTNNGFLNAGGDYGMQGILNPRGIRLSLEREVDSSTTYYLEGPIINDAQGSYLAMQYDNDLGGNVIYIDRKGMTQDSPLKLLTAETHSASTPAETERIGLTTRPVIMLQSLNGYVKPTSGVSFLLKTTGILHSIRHTWATTM